MCAIRFIGATTPGTGRKTMSKIAAILMTVLTLSLGACASFDPYDGMALQDFKHQAGIAGKGGAQLVGTKGNTEVYALNGLADHDTFYWFDDGVLRKVTQGSLDQTKKRIQGMYKASHLMRKPQPATTTGFAG